MTRLQRLKWNLYRVFWSIYGRHVWDDQQEPARVSGPAEEIVAIVRARRGTPDDWVLDAGCGTGNYAVALAKARFHVLGLDFASGMLAQARAKVTDDLAAYLSFRQADLNLSLELPDNHFDHVISISVLQAVADPMFALGELHRVLKPGGTLVLSLPRPDSRIWSNSVRELVQYRVRRLERRTPGKVLLVVLKSLGDRFHPTPRWTPSQAQQMVGAGGFEFVSFKEGRQLLVVAEKMDA